MPKPNDAVDVALLHALDIGAVDFLVSQDQGIHGRARRSTPPLADRVLTVVDAVAWLRTTFEPKEVRLPLVEEVPAHPSLSPMTYSTAFERVILDLTNGGARNACGTIGSVGL